MIQSAKKWVFGRFLDLDGWIDLILHILLEVNVFQHLATLPGRRRIIQKPEKCIFERYNGEVKKSKCSLTRLMTLQVRQV